MALPDPSPTATSLVTGASAGIGTEIARELAKRGHGVTLVARRKTRLEKLARELSKKHGVRAEALECDVGDEAARDRLAKRIEELDLHVEILVNNAGFGTFGDFVDADRERQVEMVRVNCEAVVDLTSRYLPALVTRGRGAVINIASMAAFQPLPTNATYAASKAFVLSLSEAIHEETKGTGVAVTAVCPGPVRTEFADAAGVKGAESRTPNFIWMTPEDIAKQAVSAAEKGKRAITPGLMNNASGLASRHAPHAVLLPAVKRVWGRVSEL